MTASGLKLCEIMGIAVESRHTLYKELHMQGMCLHCRISVGWLELSLARRRKQKASTLCLRDHKKKILPLRNACLQSEHVERVEPRIRVILHRFTNEVNKHLSRLSISPYSTPCRKFF